MQRHPRKKWEKHLAFLRTLPCLVCGDNTASEAAHIRLACREIGKRQTGMAEKPDDIYAVPLCGECHRKQHEIGEEQFWAENCWAPEAFVGQWLCLKALALACASGDHELGEKIVRGDA